MKYKIIVDKQSRLNPSAEKREYEIDIEELRCKGNVHDSLVITKDEDYVMRRLSLSKFHVLSVLEEPIKEPLQDINIELFEGNNYIYLVDMTGNKFYAEYLIKNEFNELYVIRSEMNSAINQSAKEIELSVNQKLTEYSTTKEMNALIQLLSQQILLEVSKKVDNEDYTAAQILLKINDDISEAQIKADKINFEGKEINLTSDNMKIKSTNFNVDQNGNITCKNANITGGNIELSSPDDTTTRLKVYNAKDNSSYTEVSPLGFCRFINGNRIIGINTKLGIIGSSLKGVSSQLYINSISDTFSSTLGNDGLTLLSSNQTVTTVKTNGITTPSLTQTSLATEKKNFEKLQNALEIIKKIDIYKYNLKNEEDGTKKHIGFVIGQDFKYAEELTSKDNNGVDIYSLSSCCLQGLKEQQEQIETLQKEVKELKEAVYGKNAV